MNINKSFKSFSGLLTNKYFLYFIVAISSLNMIGYLSMNNSDAVIFFSLIAFLMFNFSKNMIVVLLVALIATNLMTSIKGSGFKGFQEGATSGGDTLPAGSPQTRRAAKQASAYSLEQFQNDINDDNEEKKEAEEDMNGIYIDYAATLEEAYTSLQKSIDSGGMQQLSEDTKQLMKSQSDLLSSNAASHGGDSFGPLMEKAKEMIQGLDEDTIKKFAGLAASFKPPSENK